MTPIIMLRFVASPYRDKKLRKIFNCMTNLPLYQRDHCCKENWFNYFGKWMQFIYG